MRSKLFNKKNFLDKGKIILIAGCILLIVYLITKPMNIELMSNCGCKNPSGHGGGAALGKGNGQNVDVSKDIVNSGGSCGPSISYKDLAKLWNSKYGPSQCPAAVTIALGESGGMGCNPGYLSINRCNQWSPNQCGIFQMGGISHQDGKGTAQSQVSLVSNYIAQCNGGYINMEDAGITNNSFCKSQWTAESEGKGAGYYTSNDNFNAVGADEIKKACGVS